MKDISELLESHIIIQNELSWPISHTYQYLHSLQFVNCGIWNPIVPFVLNEHSIYIKTMFPVP